MSHVESEKIHESESSVIYILPEEVNFPTTLPFFLPKLGLAGRWPARKLQQVYILSFPKLVIKSRIHLQ